MFRIFAQYIGSMGLSSHYLPGSYATREEAAREATLRNCKAFCPYYFEVREA